jgi:hypothetical protein
MHSTPPSGAGRSPVHGLEYPSQRGDFQRGLLAGFMPIALLLILVALSMLATTVVRVATAGLGFGTQHPIIVSVLAGGLVIGAITYTISCVRVLRRLSGWQRAGAAVRASGALWALGIGAVILLLPLVLAALWPQHPAPTLPPG